MPDKVFHKHALFSTINLSGLIYSAIAKLSIPLKNLTK